MISRYFKQSPAIPNIHIMTQQAFRHDVCYVGNLKTLKAAAYSECYSHLRLNYITC